MPHLKIGVDLASLRLPLRKALQVAGRLGVDAVEIDAHGEIDPRQMSRTGVRQLRKMLDDRRLPLAALSFRTRRGYDTTADLGARIDGAKAAMRLAYDLGAAVVVNHIGRIPPADKAASNDDAPSSPILFSSEMDARQVLLDSLDELGRFGLHVGAVLAADTGSEDGPTMAALLAELPEGSIGVNFNPGALVAGGFSPQEAIEALGPAIRHVHATDGAFDLARRRGDRVPLGQGGVDFPEVLALLNDFDYRGFLTVQCSTAEDPVAGAARAVEYLRQF